MMARISCRPCATLCPLPWTRHKVTRHKVTSHKVSGTRLLGDVFVAKRIFCIFAERGIEKMPSGTEVEGSNFMKCPRGV